MAPLTPVPHDAPDEPLRQAYRATTSSAAGAHLSEDDWVRLAAGEVAADERDRLADHIDRCAACADLFRVVSAVDAGAHAFDPGAPRPARVGWTATRTWMGLAAAAVLVLAVMPWVRPPAPRTSTPGATTAPETRIGGTPTPPAARPGSAPAPRAWAATLPDPPAVTLPATLALEVRGGPSDRDAFLAAFGPAIAPYRAGRFAEAATALAPVATRFSDIPEAWFYLGVSHLHAGHPSDAVEPLTRASSSDALGAEARWLRVVALERAGRTTEATNALTTVCRSSEGRVSRAACDSLAATR